MSAKKNKIFPKIKKKIRWFLTDESCNVSKKDIFWVSLWAVLLSWVEEASALSYTCSVWTWHCNLSHWNSVGHSSSSTEACTAVNHASW